MPPATMPDPAAAAAAPPRRPSRTDASRLPIVWAAASRTKEGELYRRVVRDLTRHVGGKPSPTEGLLIGRIAWVQVHLAHIDERAMRDGGLSPHATREYLAWANSLAALLGRLGLKAAARKPSLSDYLAEPPRPPAAPPPAPPAAPVVQHIAPPPGAALARAYAEDAAAGPTCTRRT